MNGYLSELTGFFTGGSMTPEWYAGLRADLLRNPAYGDLAPDFLKTRRDTSALWSFAKSVDPSWEPRREYLREQFEPLIQHLESGLFKRQRAMPGPYDSEAWTGVPGGAQRAKAVRTLMPLAQSAIETLIGHLEQPSHNGGPPLDETADAINHLRRLHHTLGELLVAADEGYLSSARGEGLMEEAARYARRATKALRDDPLPFALSATLLGVFTACGFPGLGGYLSGLAMAVKKAGPKPPGES